MRRTATPTVNVVMMDHLQNTPPQLNAPRSAADLVAAARARVRSLEPADAHAAMLGGAVVVDVREREELEREGSIAGALHVPRGLLEFVADPASALHDPRLAPDRPVVLYCAVGGRSALAADTLRTLGYVDVSHLGRGFGAWRDAGLPVERPSGA